MCALVFPGIAEAAIYKCTDANGNVSYNQIPCAVEENAEAVLNINSSSNAQVDCRIANNFARQIADRMRLGQSSGVIFDSYGGIDAIPRTAVGIINYVFSHKDNLTTGSQRVTALSAARCSAGSYGPVNCSDFPYDFIAEYGGCERATMTTTAASTKQTLDVQTDRSSADGMTQALGARTMATAQPDTKDCQKDIQEQLNDLFEQMRTGQSANAQSQLEGRKKELRDKLTSC